MTRPCLVLVVVVLSGCATWKRHYFSPSAEGLSGHHELPHLTSACSDAQPPNALVIPARFGSVEVRVREFGRFFAAILLVFPWFPVDWVIGQFASPPIYPAQPPRLRPYSMNWASFEQNDRISLSLSVKAADGDVELHPGRAALSCSASDPLQPPLWAWVSGSEENLAADASDTGFRLAQGEYEFFFVQFRLPDSSVDEFEIDLSPVFGPSAELAATRIRFVRSSGWVYSMF